MVDHGTMKAYSEDLRQKVVEAVEQRGTSKSEAARLFSISLSSVKRYTKLASRGEPLTPRKGGGRPPIADETTRKLLEEDVRDRPSATVRQRRRFLESFAGKSLSDPTLRRLMKRMGFSRKKGLWGAGTRRVAKSRLEGDGRPVARCPLPGFRRRDGHQHIAFSDIRVVQEGGEGLQLGAPKSRHEHHRARQHGRGRDGAIAGRGRRYHRQGLRDLPRAGPSPHAAQGASSGDGQP